MRSVSLKLVRSLALHPHLIINPPPPRDGCKYHLSLQLPDAIFIDRDEIKDQWSGETVSWTLSPSKVDIERPVRNDTEPVRLDLELDPRVTSLDIPLHTRYLQPNAQGVAEVVLEQGAIQDGWACNGATPSLSHVPLPTGALSLSLPTGNTTHQPLVILMTPIIIWLGWTYVVRKIKNLHRRADATTKSKTL